MGLVWSLIGKLFIIRINKVVQVQSSEIITSPHPLSPVLADNMYLLLVDMDKESAQQGHRLLTDCMEQSPFAEAKSSSESQVTVITTGPTKSCMHLSFTPYVLHDRPFHYSRFGRSTNI